METTAKNLVNNTMLKAAEMFKPSEVDSTSLNSTIQVEEGTSHHTGASNAEALFHVVCIIAGTGILQIPHALGKTGWVGIAALIFSAFVVDYTGRLLIKCLYQDGKRIRGGYPEIGRLAFGPIGQYIVQFFYFTILLGITCLYIILSGQYLAELTGVLNKGHWILICSGAILVPIVALRTLKEVAIVSLLGAFASVVVALIVWVLGIMELTKPDPSRVVKHTVFDIRGLPSAFGTFLFSLGANFVYPEVERSMAKPQAFPKVLTLSMLIISVVYVATGAIGYAAYGNNVQSPVLDELPDGPVKITGILVITAHVLLACPLLLTTFSMALEHWLKIDAPYDTTRQFSIRTLIRTSTMVMIAVVAFMLPFFEDLLNLIGSVAESMLVFVFPIVFYYKIHGIKGRSLLELGFGAILVVMGVGCGVLGGIDSIQSLIRHVEQSSSPRI